MRANIIDPTNITLRPQAASLIKQSAKDFEIALALQAKTYACQRGDDVVTRKDVEEAVFYIRQRRDHGWVRELAKIIGGALLGTFLSGFILEALSTGRIPYLVFYTTCGFVGMLLIFWGLRR